MIRELFGKPAQPPSREGKTKPPQSTNWIEIAVGARKMILYFAALGGFGVVLFSAGTAAGQKAVAFWPKFAQMTGMGLLMGLASFAVGGLLGFLFVLPRAQKKDAQLSAGENQVPSGADKPGNHANDGTYLPNANLEEISDWLTKIIVGLGLIELKDIPAKLKALSEFFAQTCGSDFCGGLFLTICAFFMVMGFIFSYLLSRIYLALAFGYQSKFVEFVLGLSQTRTLSSVKAMTLTNEARVAINQNSQNQGELDKAASMLDEALESDPRYVIAYVEKARVLKRKAMLLAAGQERETLLKSALAAAQKARQLGPREYPSIYNMACYKALLGYPLAEVLQDLKDAIDLNPQLKEAAKKGFRSHYYCEFQRVQTACGSSVILTGSPMCETICT